ncbi:MAG: CBS domain-containing protein [Betaproteobacteria bacterium]|nr:CBS domain-containing protein [Betaproteobacteria bacterium]
MSQRQRTMTVAEYMLPIERFPHLDARSTIRAAISTIRSGFTAAGTFGFRNALVVDDQGALVGTVSMPVVLRGLAPVALRKPMKDIQWSFTSDRTGPEELFWDRVLAGEAGEAAEQPVGEVARPVPATVSPRDSLSRALTLILVHEVPLLPVVDEGRVVGVIRLVDIFNLVAGVIGNPKRD